MLILEAQVLYLFHCKKGHEDTAFRNHPSFEVPSKIRETDDVLKKLFIFMVVKYLKEILWSGSMIKIAKVFKDVQ